MDEMMHTDLETKRLKTNLRDLFVWFYGLTPTVIFESHPVAHCCSFKVDRRLVFGIVCVQLLLV